MLYANNIKNWYDECIDMCNIEPLENKLNLRRMKKIISGMILVTALTASLNGVEWHEWESGMGGNGHYYTVVGANPVDVLTWYDAKDEANVLGGYLVSFQSPAELNFVRKTFGKTELFWTGLTSTAGEGEFKWDDGQPVSFTKFGSERPDANISSSVVINTQQSARGHLRTGFFGAVSAFSEYRGIVEYEGEVPPTNVPDSGSPLALIAISGAAGMICRFLKK
jgi:hypothetical protein